MMKVILCAVAFLLTGILFAMVFMNANICIDNNEKIKKMSEKIEVLEQRINVLFMED